MIIPDGPPDDDWAKRVCKIGQGRACCRYLMFGRGGWSCGKHTPFKARFDQRVAADTMKAHGDNCDGRSS